MSIQLSAAEGLSGIAALSAMIPDTARDIRVNLGSVLRPDPASGLSENQIAGTALAAAYATRNAVIIERMEERARDVLSPEEMKAAASAAAIMAMNNVYYRFVHMCGDEDVARLPAGLRMAVIGSPGIDRGTFELYALAVSAINGCGMCVESHARSIAEAGHPKTAIQHVARIAAVMNGVAQAVSPGAR